LFYGTYLISLNKFALFLISFYIYTKLFFLKAIKLLNFKFKKMKKEMYLKSDIFRSQPGGDDENGIDQGGNNEGEGSKLV